MKKGLYAIYDNKAQEIIPGIINVQAHEAVAIRTFTDIALSERSQIQQHPDDYDLIRLGFLEHNDNYPGGRIGLIPAYQLILTGKTLIATLQSTNHNDERTVDGRQYVLKEPDASA